MPAQRPRATFEPIAPDLDLDDLVENTPNFRYVDRISCDTIDQQGLEAFDKLVLLHVIIGGRPLVIDGYQARLDPWTFSPKWLQQNHGEKVEQARDLRKDYLYTPLTIGHYLRNLGRLAEQFYEKADNYKDLSRQRVYLKDIDCPEVWCDKLREHLPPNLFYLNDNSGYIGGPGSVDENVPTGGKRRGRGIAGAGDLMSSLPTPMRAENLMCYIGHEGTYTPAHREMCASLGHNIMVDASEVLGEDGKPERVGSSVWFMTESKDRHTVSEYWLSILGHDIEVEKHFAQISAWKAANFTTYVVEQRPGDLILIPPMAPHQVWNRGTRTMKVAWNRTTIETLELAFQEALPNARMVCRDEQYKNKAMVYYTLQKYAALLAKVKNQQQTASSPQEAAQLRASPKIRQLQKDFKRLFRIFRDIMLSEMFSPDNPTERNVEFLPFDSNVTCAYCRGNIFNRFLSCKTCDDQLLTTDPEPYDVCMECYTMGRSCVCISKLRWTEQFKWKELVQKYDNWRKLYVELEGGTIKPETPQTLQEERAALKTKTLAQICQEQLKRRPWVDIHKPDTQKDDEEDEEILINEDGTVKKRKKKRSEAWLKNNHACHVCCHRHENWKMAECKCGRWWCYGTLFRGFDTMPQQIMAEVDWRCPHCRGVCFAGNCRKDPRQKPYEPKGTLLGHDTRKVADARSVESLVDFSVSNLNWLKEAAVEAPFNSHRLQQRQEEAERAKEMDVTLDAHYATDEEEDPGVRQGEAAGIHYSLEDSTIDPRLGGANVEYNAIDPALHTPNGANGPSQVDASITSNIAALLNSDQTAHSHDNRGEYVPAQQTIAPAAIMLSAPDAEGDEDDFAYGSDGLSRVDENLARNVLIGGKKRKRTSGEGAKGDKIKRAPPKRPRQAIDIDALPDATKQYRREQERKALEEARKAGHFIQLHAALRGRSLLVKLKINPRSLARIVGMTDKNKNDADNDLLKSDVAPAVPAAKPAPPREEPASGGKKPKAVRIRVERDEDFGTRRRHKTDKDGKPLNRPEEPLYEEVTIDSDDSVLGSANEDDTGGGRADISFSATTDSSRKGRRTSAWQNRRHKDSGVDDHVEELDALPNNWKDSRKRVRNSDGQTKAGAEHTSKNNRDTIIIDGPSTSHMAAGPGSSQTEGGVSTTDNQSTEISVRNLAASVLNGMRGVGAALGVVGRESGDANTNGNGYSNSTTNGGNPDATVNSTKTLANTSHINKAGSRGRGTGGPRGRAGRIVGSRSKVTATSASP